jgi:hypothetical protein
MAAEWTKMLSRSSSAPLTYNTLELGEPSSQRKRVSAILEGEERNVAAMF